LLSASGLAYVDLNPIRAAICDTPEHSDFTSVQSRINAINVIDTAATVAQAQPSKLLPFTGYVPHGSLSSGLPFKLFDYLALVEWCIFSCIAIKRNGVRSCILHFIPRNLS
jgi:hypothetical protein